MEKEQCKSQIVVSRKHTLCTHRYHGNTQHPCTLKKYYIRKSITTYLKEMYLYFWLVTTRIYVVWDTCAFNLLVQTTPAELHPPTKHPQTQRTSQFFSPL